MPPKKYPVTANMPGYKEFEWALFKANDAIGWKSLTAFAVNWFRKFQPEDRTYSLEYWLHDTADPVINANNSFKILITLDAADEEIEQKLVKALSNNHFAFHIRQSHDEDPIRIYVSTMMDRVHVLNKIIKRIVL
jgi:hypothetical protein